MSIPGLGLLPSPWVLLGAVVFLAIACVASYHFGTSTQKNADEAEADRVKLATDKIIADANERRYNAVADLIVDQAAKDEKAAAALAEARANVQTVTRVIHDKVPEYVTPAADARCIVPVGFVQLHDAAARGERPAESQPAAAAGDAGSVDRPSGIALSAVEATVVDNYGACSEWKTELIAWRAYKPTLETWYANLQRAVNGVAPTGASP